MVFRVKFSMQNQNMKLKNLNNEDFENSSLSLNMPWHPDSLPNSQWKSEYILILKLSEKLVHGFSSSIFDAKSENETPKAQKWRFWEFIYELEYAVTTLIACRTHNEKWVYFDPKIIWETGSCFFEFTFRCKIRISNSKSSKMNILKIHLWAGICPDSLIACRTDYEKMSIFWS